MQEWVSINECDIGTPDIYRFPQVDGLLTGPPELGYHNFVPQTFDYLDYKNAWFNTFFCKTFFSFMVF